MKDLDFLNTINQRRIEILCSSPEVRTRGDEIISDIRKKIEYDIQTNPLNLTYSCVVEMDRNVEQYVRYKLRNTSASIVQIFEPPKDGVFSFTIIFTIKEIK